MQCDSVYILKCRATMPHAYWIAAAAAASAASAVQMPVTLRCAAKRRQWNRCKARDAHSRHYIEWRMRQNEAESTLIKVLCASSSQCFSFTPCPSLRFVSLFFSLQFSFRHFVFFFVFSVSLVLLFFNVSIKTCEPNENPYHVTILLSSCLTSVRTFFQIGFYTVIWNSMVMLLPFLLFIRRVLLTSFSFSLFYLTFCCALLCSFGFCSVHAVFFLRTSIRFVSLLWILYAFVFVSEGLFGLFGVRWVEMRSWVEGEFVRQVSRTFKCLLTKEEEQALPDSNLWDVLTIVPFAVQVCVWLRH